MWYRRGGRVGEEEVGDVVDEVGDVVEEEMW